MSQLTATVRNPGARSGCTAVAGSAPGGGVSFTDLEMPDVPDHEDMPSFRDGPPPEVPDEYRRDPLPFWAHVVEGKPALGHVPWEDYDPVTSERAAWQRLNDPPLLPDGRLDPIAYLVLADMMPGAVAEKLGPGTRPAVVRPERRPHRPPFEPASPGLAPLPQPGALGRRGVRLGGDGASGTRPTGRSSPTRPR